MGGCLGLAIALFFGVLWLVPPTFGGPGGTLLQAPPIGSENAAADPIQSQTDGAAPIIGPNSAASIVLAAIALGCAAWIVRRRLHDPLAPAAVPEPPFGRVADWPVLLLGGMVVWVAQSAGAKSAAVLFSLADDGIKTLRGGALVSLGGYLAAFIGVVFTLSVLPDMARRIRVHRDGARTASAVLVGVGAFALVFPIVMTVGWIASIIARVISGEAPDAVAHETLRLLSDPKAVEVEGSLWWWLTVGSVLIGAPIAEEIVYRGFIQGAIRRAVLWSAQSKPGDGLRVPPSRRAAWTAILGTSFVFAFMHAGVAETHALFTLFALSVCFGVVCERTGRLIAPILMHVLFNAANIALSVIV
jgi:membrane protease YdiL (CAAX protease family)